MLKKSLSYSDYFLIAVNLVPLWGVWFNGWNPGQIFLVYCFESVITGIYQLIKMGMITVIKKNSVWNEGTANPALMPGWFFMLFFLLHYGFFIFIQLFIFTGISSIKKETGDSGALQLLLHFPRYLNDTSKWLLLLFVVSYGLIMIKDFVLTGEYRVASLNSIMFQPYMRIFVQQFTVISGSFFLGFGAGKIFMLVFIAARIFFEILLPYDAILAKAQTKKSG